VTRRVLIVAYYFPPLGGIGSLRVAGFARHLPEFGWEPVVLAPRHGAYHRDPDSVYPEERVLRTGSFELSRIGKRVLRAGGDDVLAAPVTGARAVARDAAHTLLYHPDSKVGWYLPAVATARRELRRRPPDAILSSSFPITAHLIARRLQHVSGAPWLADFRDPWSQMMAPGIARRRAARLERSLARDATAVTMTSPSWAARHAQLWGRPVSVIPPGFEGVETAQPPAEFVLSYLGSYYPATQDLTAAWSAIRRLADGAGPAVDRVRFIGDLHPQIAGVLAGLDLSGLVEETGFIAHGAAIEHLRDSSALLLAGPRDAAGILRGQVAGKIPEYLATGLPVIYVGDPDCDAAAMLRAHDGCHVCATNDVDAVVRALVACRGETIARNVDGLTRGAIAGRLAALLDDATSKGGGRA
jgi:hypothetical protein